MNVFALNRHAFRRAHVAKGFVQACWAAALTLSLLGVGGCQTGPAASPNLIKTGFSDSRAPQPSVRAPDQQLPEHALARRVRQREAKSRTMLANNDIAAPPAGPETADVIDQAIAQVVDDLIAEVVVDVNAPTAQEPAVQPVAYQQEDWPVAAQEYSEYAYQAPAPAPPCPACLPPVTNGEACTPEMQIFAADEYICDGGDSQLGVVVDRDWTVRGIDPTDTVAHYDTRQGQTLVDASNRVCIYAPRFAAVRKIDGVVQNSFALVVGDIGKPLRVQSQDRNAIVSTTLQPLEPKRNVGMQAANLFLDREAGIRIDNVTAPLGVRDRLPPFEDFRILRDGVAENAEKLRLNEWVQAARYWMINKAVQVTIDEQPAVEAAVGVTPGETVLYEIQGKSRLRIVKVASTQSAQPGETVDFTLRFDNVGDQVIGNVTILDHLTNRLEYVADSQTCSLEHTFLTDEKAETLVLRWEIKQPLKVGEGGIIRFRCVVR